MRRSSSRVIDELIVAEAAAWLTRLQGTARSPVVDAAFREWLAADPAHAHAFARVNDVWEIVPGAAVVLEARESASLRSSARRTPWRVAAACAALLLLAAGAANLLKSFFVDKTYQTAVGAQQTIVLADHTRITLNTDTRLVVEYRDNERRIRLERGEALFKVTRNPERPFVVLAGGARIVDIGTIFDVHRAPEKTAVTLVEGKVQVSDQAAPFGQAKAGIALVPGERLTLYAHKAPVLVRQNIQQALAWQEGRIYFDDTSLADAVTEMNRYGGPTIRVEDPGIAALRISGVFSTHDPSEFALAVASLHHLQTVDAQDTIVLTR